MPLGPDVMPRLQVRATFLPSLCASHPAPVQTFQSPRRLLRTVLPRVFLTLLGVYSSPSLDCCTPLQVEWSAGSSSSSSDGEGPWGADTPDSAGSPCDPCSSSDAQQPQAQPEAGACPASVRGRPAYFEALVRANTETMITVRSGQLCLNRHSAQRRALPDSTGNRSCSGSSSFQSRNRSDTACSRALSQHWQPHVSAFRGVLQLLCRGCELTRCLAALVAQCTHSDRAPAAGAASGSGGGAGAAGAGGIWAAAERGDGGGACQALVLSSLPSAEVRASGKGAVLGRGACRHKAFAGSGAAQPLSRGQT